MRVINEVNYTEGIRGSAERMLLAASDLPKRLDGFRWFAKKPPLSPSNLVRPSVFLPRNPSNDRARSLLFGVIVS